MRNTFLIALLHLPLALMLFILVNPARAGSLTETDKSVRSIVSGIVSYTRWPALSGQPKLCIYASSRYRQALSSEDVGNDSNLLIVFYVQIMPDDFVMQLHR
ncbi:YfiR family protein, partial [Enterobacter hormaechei]|nr:YfiR family protein [Enterobacter hormaechei]